jgi:DNA-binding NarL/FixJ family response regulator
MAKLRILVADDHLTVRRGICEVLSAESDFEVIHDVSDGIQAVLGAKELRPDVVVLEITKPEMDGFEAARRIQQVCPSAEILFLRQHDTVETVKQAFLAGGRGYVVKSDAAKLVPAVRMVSEKKRYVNPRFAVLLG